MMKTPELSVVVSKDVFRSTFVAVTAAPGTTAPVESRTVPVITPLLVVVCAASGHAGTNKQRTIVTILANRIFSSRMPSEASQLLLSLDPTPGDGVRRLQEPVRGSRNESRRLANTPPSLEPPICLPHSSTQLNSSQSELTIGEER